MSEDIAINIPPVIINGIINVPKKPKGIVLFSHGSGSSRFSKRNSFVAEILNQNGFATFLLDLLTKEEDLIYENRFDIELLTQRLLSVTDWVKKQPELKELPIGYFGASTGAASALKASAQLGKTISAIVSRGGRPDLAESILDKVQSPTLLIVGGKDYQVIDFNRHAFEKIISIKELVIVPNATHLFAEPGTLEKVAELSVKWFEKYLDTANSSKAS